MLVSLSAKRKLDSRKYRWYTYQGRKAKFNIEAQPEYEISLTKGERFGVKHYKGHVYLVDPKLEVQLRLSPFDAERILNNSRGWEGRVGTHKTTPGSGGKDKSRRAPRRDTEGRVVLRMDSSLFRSGTYDPKTKTLYVQFRSGAQWQYANVKPSEAIAFERAKSQGSWFNDHIKGVKEESRLDSPERRKKRKQSR